jgi:hypothetical protein
MGLSDLIDKLEHNAPVEEITATLRDNILEQTCSKYNNALLVIKSDTYKQVVKEAEQAGRAEASTSAKAYENNLLDKAKEQACLKADSEFSRLLADEHSKIVPRVDTEIVAEHTKFISKRCKTLVSQLDSLSLDAEKEFVLAAATRLGLTLEGTGQLTKKAKLDTCKPRPALITPRGRSASITSNTSQVSQSRKRAYSLSEVVVLEPLPSKPKDRDTTPKQIHTVNFTIKQETVPPLTFVTPSTPSTIRQAVELAQDISLRGSTSSMHNLVNVMAVDLEAIDYCTIFPPGIPAPPSNPSLPPQMSRTPDFGGDQEGNDSVAPSISMATPPTDPIAFIAHNMNKAIADAMGPIWATVHCLEAAVMGGPVRVPPRSGLGYCSEHINRVPAHQVQPTTIAPVLTNQGTKSWVDNQGATPFPQNDELHQSKIVTDAPRVDDDDTFPPLERETALKNHRQCNNLARERQRQSVPGATGPNNDDRHITIVSNQSRIHPLFANVTTQAAINQQQRGQVTANQARAIQGRKPSGNQGSCCMMVEAELTEVAIICFGSMQDKEAECKFRARNPIEIVQAVQCELAK